MLIFSKKNDKISKYFYAQQEDVADCFEKFEDFFKLLFSEDATRNALESAKVAVDNAENAADEELIRIVNSMKETFLPATRKNLISLAQATDSIANKCQSIVRKVYLEKIMLPEDVRSDLLQIIATTEDQVRLLYKAIDKLLNDYAGLDKDRKVLYDIRDEESRVDKIEAMLHERMFAADLPLFEKVYYWDVVEKVCNISDLIENIADQIQVMLIEREA
ncbi:MAG: DUF47 family protein [Clostridia bacterium]|nr:DUF47 family protein [Clostridia bacterium]